MITLFRAKRSSSLAMAIALATGAAVVTTAVMPVEASAQRKKKKKDEENDGGGYSKEFREAYTPIDELMKEEGSDLASARSQIDAMAALLTTPDEKIAGGGLMFNAAVRLKDPALQFRGMEFMLESGKVPADQLGRYNFIAYQLSANQADKTKNRGFLQAAIDNKFTSETINDSVMRIQMMESFFADRQFDAGFDFVRKSIDERKAAGQTADETWYRRAWSVAYENELSPAVYDMVSLLLRDYPTQKNWGDAINIARNLNDYGSAEMLDLFRLARKTGVLTEARDYDFYVEVADARRLPSEVKAVIAEGMAAGVLSDGNLYISEQLGIADGRIAADRADLPALEADASAPDAGIRTVGAAGDTFLSYGEYAKAARFYERSLTMPGVELEEELTRLGIAQIGLGDYAAARSTLNRINGPRLPLAKLWTAYANELEAKTVVAPVVAPSEAPATAAAS